MSATGGGALPGEVVAALQEVVGPANVVTDPAVSAGYATDWTGRFAGWTPAVVRPATAAEVAGTVAVCAEHGVALVPQGGLTGLVGGSVPLAGEVVLNLRRMDQVGEIDPAAGQVTVEAGATIAAVQRAADKAGWVYGIDFGARDSATIGGSIATNAGGLHLLRYGNTRQQVLGVEAVLGNGAVISHLGGLLKDNTGYDLAGLLCGSEGTLGVVTRARLRLHPPAPERVAAMVGFASVAAAIEAASTLRRSLPSLEACELSLAAGLHLVAQREGRAGPFGDWPPAVLFAGCAALQDPTGELAAVVDALAGVTGVAVAADPVRRGELWHWREAITEAINSVGPPHKLDVTIPAGALAEFVDVLPSTVAAVAPAAAVWLFGHAADGNIHVNITGVDPADERIDDVVLQLVATFEGSISAEHGIGTAKKRWLHLNRSATEIDAFAAIKRALDPGGILNPNVLLP